MTPLARPRCISYPFAVPADDEIVPDPVPDTRRKRAFALADALHLTREERHELAEMLLKRDVASWGSLSNAEMGRMVDALEGYALTHALMLQRA